MAKPKLVKVDAIIRGDTPLLVFPITLNREPFDLTDWNGYFTLTNEAAPIDNTGAVVALAEMVKDIVAGTMSFQLTNTITAKLVPETTYYFDVQVNREPVDINNFTVIRGELPVVTDYGVGTS